MQPVERALDVALIVMQNGGSTVMADRTFQNILKGYKQDGVSAAWRIDFVAASSVAEGQFSTILRPVGPIGVNLIRASEAAVLGERVARGEVNTAALEYWQLTRRPTSASIVLTICSTTISRPCWLEAPWGNRELAVHRNVGGETDMKIAMGSDHAGFELKESVRALLRELGHEVIDLGTHDTTPVDYPDFAEAVGKTVLDGKAERGIMICGNGVGASVAANKIPGIRAGLCHDTYSAHQGVEHDHMNVLVLGGRVIGPAMAHELVQAFVNAERTQEERHLRRLAKVHTIEERYTRK